MRPFKAPLTPYPTGSSTANAAIVFAAIDNANYYWVIVNRQTGKISLHQVTSGSPGSALASAGVTIADNTAYTLTFTRKQKQVVATPGTASFTYNSSSDFGTGQSGLYANRPG